MTLATTWGLFSFVLDNGLTVMCMGLFCLLVTQDE